MQTDTLFYRLFQNWPQLALVIYPTRGTEKPASIEFEPLLELPQLKRIFLEDYQHNTEPDYNMLRLIACSVEETATLAQELAKQPEKLGKEVIEFIETVLVYKLPNLSREEIRTMLGLNDVTLKQTRFYQEIAEEERREGRQEGLQEGLLRGRQDGKLQGETQLLIKILSKRFGALPEELLHRLAEANIEQLELWGERILDAKTLADVFE